MSKNNSPLKSNIIWDLSGTLFRPTRWGLSAQEVADLSLVFYMWSGKKEPSKLDTYAIDLLNQAEGKLPRYQVIRLHTGDPVPAIVCSLLAGLVDSATAYKKTMNAAELVPNPGLTVAEFEQVHRMIKAFFDPLSLSRCMQPIALSEALVKQCAKNPNNTFYVLSNWDRESFDNFFKTRSFENALHYFERSHILISADIGYIKPQPEIYENFLTRFALDPKTCFFIDDQPENIAGAKTFGIEGMQFKVNDSHELMTRLKDLTIIH